MAGEEEIVIQQSRRTAQGAMGLGILGWIQVTPRWKNDPVWGYKLGNRREVWGRCGHPPSLVGKHAEGGEGRNGLIRVVAYATIIDRA